MTELASLRSITRGRLRLRDPRLKGSDGGIADILEKQEGVISATVNPLNGSLLLLWDESVLAGDEAVAAVAALLPGQDSRAGACVECGISGAASRAGRLRDCVLDQLSPIVAPDAGVGEIARRVAQNRILLGSAVATVLSLPVKGNLHAACGVLLLLLMSAHLIERRRAL